MKKALIAMSGGIDSSVAVYLMKEQGFDCVGATMQLYNGCNNAHKKDIEDAKKVADLMGIPHYVYDFTEDFEKEVIGRFVKVYEDGDTPNPCVICNKHIKWNLLFDKMNELGLDYVVSGHYARIKFNDEIGEYILRKGLDESKDQSYVLYNMTQEQLAHTLLPLGELSKEAARNIAEQQNFHNARKQDSQDICFIPDGDYAKFIEEYTGKNYEKGNFIDKNGKILGEHKGLIRYTIGQRKGLGLALPKPQYVCRKSIEDNTVILGDNEDLFTRKLIASDFNWISSKIPTEPIRIKAKTRYKHKEQWATAKVLENNEVEIVFDEPQRAITTGQAVVLYDGDILIGGGTIKITESNI